MKTRGLGIKIRGLRLENKLSQEELATKLDIAQTSISNIESGKTIPDFLIMEKICEVFNVGMDYFSGKNKEKYIIKKNENSNIVVGKIETLNNTMPEGFLENMLKRIELLETMILKIRQTKQKR